MLTAVPSLFIDGEWVAATSGTCSPVVNPSDATVVTEVDVADDVDIARAIAAARRAFDETDWPWRPAGERAALLTRTADLLERDRAEIAREETLNTGKALRESEYDVDDVISVFRYYAGLADKEAGRLVATTDAERAEPHRPRAPRCLRADRTVELPAAADLVEGRAGAGGGQHDGRQADEPPR